MKMNQVSYLLSLPTISDEDRLIAKEFGRPCPSFSLRQSYEDRSGSHTRSLCREYYEINRWICGCSERNAFFCYVCLLFGGRDDSWARTGVTDLLPLWINIHDDSTDHLKNELSFALLGKVNIERQLDDVYLTEIRKHNEQVDRDRFILTRVIDGIKFCLEFELTLRGHGGCYDKDPRVLQGLVNCTSAIERVLRPHLENNSTVCKGPYKIFRDDLLDAMLNVSRWHIVEEVSKARFVSIQVDETTDVTCKSQLSIILRYAAESRVIERFWGFCQVKDTEVAADMSAILLEQLKEVGLDKESRKLIAQSYNGPNIMREDTLVHHLIKEKYPDAIYLHCYAHHRNSLVRNATDSVPQSRVFFSDLLSIRRFFKRPERMERLAEAVKARTPADPLTSEYLREHSVNAVYENKDSLLECFQMLRDSPDSDMVTITEASGFIRLLSDNQFLFWLEFYHLIMTHVTNFFDTMEQSAMDATKSRNTVQDFLEAVSKVQRGYEDDALDDGEVHSAKRACTHLGSSRNNRIAALQICDTLRTTIYERFNFDGHISAAQLFNCKSFSSYNDSFPEDVYSETLQSYPDVNGAKLKRELKVLYNRLDVRAAPASALLWFFIRNNLTDIFSESLTILKSLITVPMTTGESERVFSTLGSIQGFLSRNPSTSSTDRRV